MDPAALDRVLTSYTTDDLRAEYAAPGNASQDRFFQLRKINGKEIILVRSGENDTRVFQPVATLEDLRTYLGPAPNPARPRTLR